MRDDVRGQRSGAGRNWRPGLPPLFNGQGPAAVLPIMAGVEAKLARAVVMWLFAKTAGVGGLLGESHRDRGQYPDEHANQQQPGC